MHQGQAHVPVELTEVGSSTVRTFRLRRRDGWLLLPFVQSHHTPKEDQAIVQSVLTEVQSKFKDGIMGVRRKEREAQAAAATDRASEAAQARLSVGLTSDEEESEAAAGRAKPKRMKKGASAEL